MNLEVLSAEISKSNIVDKSGEDIEVYHFVSGKPLTLKLTPVPLGDGVLVNESGEALIQSHVYFSDGVNESTSDTFADATQAVTLSAPIFSLMIPESTTGDTVCQRIIIKCTLDRKSSDIIRTWDIVIQENGKIKMSKSTSS